jgi:dolichol-phosphate mannosyltransferase
MLLSVVSPAHNEEKNLPILYERLKQMLDGQDGVEWEWVVVDDHSSDSTFQVLSALAVADPRVRAVRFSRNFGSHKAILCGLHEARGDGAVVMSSDLQDPPGVILSLMQEWRRSGSQIVWAEREQRGDTGSNLLFARLYYWLMRRVVGLPNLPPNGAQWRRLPA